MQALYSPKNRRHLDVPSSSASSLGYFKGLHTAFPHPVDFAFFVIYQRDVGPRLLDWESLSPSTTLPKPSVFLGVRPYAYAGSNLSRCFSTTSIVCEPSDMPPGRSYNLHMSSIRFNGCLTCHASGPLDIQRSSDVTFSVDNENEIPNGFTLAKRKRKRSDQRRLKGLHHPH